MRDIVIGRSGDTPYVELRIRTSKTDKRSVGATVTITGRTKDNIRVADLLNEWLAVRSKAGPGPEDPLFTAWDLDAFAPSNSPIKSGQALALRLNKHLTEMKQAHPQIAINPATYGMHSLRRGGVMAAWKAGVDVEKIKAHGRWKSDAIKAYMHTTRQMRLMVTTSM
jgi:hypothetical protein